MKSQNPDHGRRKYSGKWKMENW